MSSSFSTQASSQALGGEFSSIATPQLFSPEVERLVPNMVGQSPAFSRLYAETGGSLPPSISFDQSALLRKALPTFPISAKMSDLPEIKISFLGRRLFKRFGGTSWGSLNGEAKRVKKEAENRFFVDSLASNERVSRLTWTQTVQQMYEKTDEQLKKEWCITRLFNRVQEFVFGIAKVREAITSRVEKLFRGYSPGHLVESFARDQFADFESLIDGVTDGLECAPAKEGTSRYFVKEVILQDKAHKARDRYEIYC